MIIVPDYHTVVEYGVNEWPPYYKPFPEKPKDYVELSKVKIVGPKPIHKFTYPASTK
jgi:hypothetical protein